MIKHFLGRNLGRLFPSVPPALAQVALAEVRLAVVRRETRSLGLGGAARGVLRHPDRRRSHR